MNLITANLDCLLFIKSIISSQWETLIRKLIRMRTLIRKKYLKSFDLAFSTLTNCQVRVLFAFRGLRTINIWINNCFIEKVVTKRIIRLFKKLYNVGLCISKLESFILYACWKSINGYTIIVQRHMKPKQNEILLFLIAFLILS